MRRSTIMMALRNEDISAAEVALVRQARTGSVGAFEALYRAYNQRIYGFARSIVGYDADASDVVQETFVRAWRSLPGLREEAAFRGWLYRIALNRANELLARRRRSGEVSLDVECVGLIDTPSTGDGPEDCAVKSEMAVAIDKAMAGLNPDHRAVVAMHHMQGMEVAEVAKLLRLPQGTVLSRLARARAALRRRLAPYVEVSDGEDKLS